MSNGASTSPVNAPRGPLATAAAAAPQSQSQAATQEPQSNAASTNSNTAAPAANGQSPPPAPSTPGLVYPALHLLPLNDTFVPKQISLSPVGTRVKIGRQTNAKTVPSATNGYFDSKVLSRMHAEVWCEDGKIYIKDVKSSNGTFINGDRLSPESAESDAFELHSEDVVEFGIDIVSDDNKTIVHHKVSTKIHLAITAEEAVALMKNLPALYRMHDTALHRRPSKAGLTFDHVFNRLQSELHKSRETGGELGGLTTTMAEIHDTLGGGVPPPLPSFPQPLRGGHYNQVAAKGMADPQTLALLQAQLTDTQASLAGHADKVRGLESLLAEHESMKKEVGVLRDNYQSTRREMDEYRMGSIVNGSEDAHDADAEDDAASIASDSTLRSSAHRGPSTTADRALREQNTALLARLDELSRDLREATTLTQSLLAQQEAAATAVQALESRVAQLENDIEEGRGRLEAWKRQYELDIRRDQGEWAAERQRLQAAIAQWQTTGQLDAAAWPLPRSEEPLDETKISTETGAAADSRPRRKSRPHRTAHDKTATDGQLSATDINSAIAVADNADPSEVPAERGSVGKAKQSASGSKEERLPHARPPDQRKTAGASLQLASSIGILAIGVAVFALAHRD